jgi:hypothetical protein
MTGTEQISGRTRFGATFVEEIEGNNRRKEIIFSDYKLMETWEDRYDFITEAARTHEIAKE